MQITSRLFSMDRKNCIVDHWLATAFISDQPLAFNHYNRKIVPENQGPYLVLFDQNVEYRSFYLIFYKFYWCDCYHHYFMRFYYRSPILKYIIIFFYYFPLLLNIIIKILFRHILILYIYIIAIGYFFI